ncbi:MAG: sporulation protein [Defluviitaleaceae bacterium]|nr:sporulation protein [Defluviitaleaceae bacterium]
MKDTTNNLETIFSILEDFISTKTVVGDPIHVGDTTILPLIDVTFGFGAGFGNNKKKNGDNGNGEKSPGKGGGGGGGAKIEPSAVIVVNQKTSHVQLVNVKNQDSLNKIIDMAPGILTKIQESFAKRKSGKSEFTETEEKEEDDNNPTA